MSDPLDHLRSEGDINLSSQRKQWQDRHITNPETRRLLEEDARWFLHQSLSTPCLNVIESSLGAGFTDTDGRTYLDFHGNYVHQVGFGHPRVIAAITRQMQQLSFSTRRYTNKPAIALARKLAALAPGDLNRVLLAPGGTSAMGMAVKLARAATGRFKTISLWDSFHGASLDMISIGGEAVFRKDAGPLLPGTEHAPPPDAHHCLWDCSGTCKLKCADYIAYMLEKEGDVAAVIAETVRSTPFIPPPEYWQRVREACDRHGTLLILDEIPHGLGRTGKMFTVEHYDIVPDIIVLGKGLGGGIFPLAAVIASDRINDSIKDKAIGHYTHEKNPVACAAALETIAIIEDEKLLDRSATLGEKALQRMKELIQRFTFIGDVRGLGLLLGIEIVKSRATMERDHERAEQIMYGCMERGLSFKLTMGNILTLAPALIISENDLMRAFDIIEEAMADI